MLYAAARDALVVELLKDAVAHDAQRYDEVGRRFDALERALSRGEAPELAKLRVAFAFWDGWIDARNRGWQQSGNITQAEWPLLARGIASDLIADREISNARIRSRFDARARGLVGERVRTLAARMHEV